MSYLNIALTIIGALISNYFLIGLFTPAPPDLMSALTKIHPVTSVTHKENDNAHP